MKKKIVYFFIFTVIAILQLSLLPQVTNGKIAADAVLMAILAWSILDGFLAFLSWAIFFGLFYDLITYTRVGIHALVFLIVVYSVSFFSRRFSVEFKGIGLVVFLIFILFSMLVSRAIIALPIALKLQSFHSYWQLLGSIKIIFIQFIGNIFLFFFSFILINKAKQFFSITV